ncbi:MAG: hypothetical protein N2109_00200 [Fimbriimonadales bacterium]|nr:hypothetical protein [Fimbriimonadales bacterium]
MPERHADTGDIADSRFCRTVWHWRRGLPGFGGGLRREQPSGGDPRIDPQVNRLDRTLVQTRCPEPECRYAASCDLIARRLAEAYGESRDADDVAVPLVRFWYGATRAVEAF